MKGFVERTRELAEKVGNPRAQSLCYNFLGALEYLRGDWTDAIAHLRHSIHLDREFRAASGEALGLQRLGHIETALGEFRAAQEHLQRGLEVAERATMAAHCLVRLYASLGHNCLEADDLDGAARYLQDGLAAQDRHGKCVTCNVLFYPIGAAIYTRLGDLTAAQSFCEMAEQAADEYQSTAWIAMARRARGILQLAGGDPDAAATCFQETAARFAAIGQPYDAAVSQTYHAEALLAQGSHQNRRLASGLLAEAHKTLTSLRARPALTRVEQLLDRDEQTSPN